MTLELTWTTPRLWQNKLAGFTHCPGCHHGLISKAVAEAIDDLGLEGQAIEISGVGCSARNFLGFSFDGIFVPHGRALDVGTGIKRALGDDSLVFTMQGDGDCMAIGIEALISSAARAEKITAIMINNGCFGTTGGQMAPTTLMQQRTTTTPHGRDPSAGYPLHGAELVASIKGVAYSARGAVHTPAHYRRTRKYIRTAFEKQKAGAGFTFVEVLSACPTDWHLSPVESLEWIDKTMCVEYPLGEFHNTDEVA